MTLRDYLAEALHAVRSQDWAAALDLLESAEATGTLTLDEQVQMLSARGSAHRHQGKLVLARNDYIQLSKLLVDTPDDPRHLESIVGLAECYLAAGDLNTTNKVIQMSGKWQEVNPIMRLRLSAIHARMLSRIDIPASIQAWSHLMRDDLVPGSARANARFYYGDSLLAAGMFAQARQQYVLAMQEADELDATKTVADCLRREALIRVALNERSHLQEAFELLQEAETLYEQTGDRARSLVHTERALVLAHLGQLPRARESYETGRWAARESRENLRLAHNQLGLADLLRCTDSWELIEDTLAEAERLYHRLGVAWGEFYCRVVRLLALYDQGRIKEAAQYEADLNSYAQELGNRLSEYDRLWLQNLKAESYKRKPLRLRFPD